MQSRFKLHQAGREAAEELLKSQPALVKSMVKATQKSWLAYLKNPSLANKEILKRNPELGSTLGRSSALLAGLMQSEPFGHMTPERWQKLASQLKECGVLKAVPKDLEKAYTVKYLEN